MVKQMQQIFEFYQSRKGKNTKKISDKFRFEDQYENLGKGSEKGLKIQGTIRNSKSSP